MKNKITERHLWVVGVLALIAAAWYSHTQEQTQINQYQFLLNASALEHKILLGEVREHKRVAAESESSGYRRGYADGAANMGTSLMSDKTSFVNYSDGYHAAMHQFGYQTEGLSSASTKINSRLAVFEKHLMKEEYDAAAILLTSIIINLEDRLEDVFTAAVSEPPLVEEDAEIPDQPKLDSQLTPEELTNRLLEEERDKAFEDKLMRELEKDLELLTREFDIEESEDE